MISQEIVDFFNDQISPEKFDWSAVKMPADLTGKYQQFDWIMRESGIPWLKLDIDIPYKEMLNEALALKDMFVAHRDYGQGSNDGWRSLCIHGLAWDRTLYFNNYEEYKHLTAEQEHQVPHQWCPEVADRCPVTVDFFKNKFPYSRYSRLRFMWLDPGATIEIHRDSQTRMLYPVNISLNNPEGCKFRMKNCGDIPFIDQGSAYAIDVSNFHSVWNNSDTPRIHIIAHGYWGNDGAYQDLVVDSFNKFIQQV
jgi:hypothetical protein